MLSFFRRKKSRDEGGKKEKFKSKDSTSAFFLKGKEVRRSDQPLNTDPEFNTLAPKEKPENNNEILSVEFDLSAKVHHRFSVDASNQQNVQEPDKVFIAHCTLIGSSDKKSSNSASSPTLLHEVLGSLAESDTNPNIDCDVWGDPEEVDEEVQKTDKVGTAAAIDMGNVNSKPASDKLKEQIENFLPGILETRVKMCSSAIKCDVSEIKCAEIIAENNDNRHPLLDTSDTINVSNESLFKFDTEDSVNHSFSNVTTVLETEGGVNNRALDETDPTDESLQKLQEARVEEQPYGCPKGMSGKKVTSKEVGTSMAEALQIVSRPSGDKKCEVSNARSELDKREVRFEESRVAKSAEAQGANDENKATNPSGIFISSYDVVGADQSVNKNHGSDCLDEADWEVGLVLKKATAQEKLMSTLLFPPIPIIKSESHDSVSSSKAKKKVRWADEDGELEFCFEERVEPSDEAEDESSSEKEVYLVNGEGEKEDGGSSENDDSEEDESSSQEEESESDDEMRVAPKEEVAENCAEVLTSDGSELRSCGNNTGSSSSEDEDTVSECESGNEKDDYVLRKAPKDEEDMPGKKREIEELSTQIGLLKRDLQMKRVAMDRLQSDLITAYDEADQVRRRFKRLEEEMATCRRSNFELAEQLKVHYESRSRKENEEKIAELQEKICKLERELAQSCDEKTNLEFSCLNLKKEKDKEIRLIQQALDEALAGQKLIETRYEKEFEELRTHHSNREAKMLDDFEWKLREVEKGSKKRLADKEKEVEKTIIELSAKLRAAEVDLGQISHLKGCEIELNHLKSTSHDQKRTLRNLTRKYEELQVNEKILQEEVNRLRSSLEKEKAHFSAIQMLHKDDLAEKERKLQFKLEYQKNQLTYEWEDKLKRECSNLKSDLEKAYREEKIVAVEGAKRLKDIEIQQLKQYIEKKTSEFNQEIKNYQHKLSQTSDTHKSELLKAQTNADRELFELRRKLDKLDMSYQEQIEKMQEAHEQEIIRLKNEWEKKVQQCESSLQLQAGTTRTTVELVKHQFQNEAQQKLIDMEANHHLELDKKCRELDEEKRKEIDEIKAKQKQIIEQLENEIKALNKEMRMQKELTGWKLFYNMFGRGGGQNPVKQTHSSYPSEKGADSGTQSDTEAANRLALECAERRSKEDDDQKTNSNDAELQNQLVQLSKQVAESQQEIEKLRHQLAKKDASQPMNNTPHQQQHQQPHYTQHRRNKNKRRC